MPRASRGCAASLLDVMSLCGQKRFRTKLPSKLDDDIRRKTGAPCGFPDRFPAFRFIETIGLSLVRRQKRIQPFDSGNGVDIDYGLQILCGNVQRRGEISFYHE